MPIKHALVVDDSKSARFSLKKLLQQQDIKTDFAESAGDALNYLSSNTPDIIFMDHLMPGMDGFEATKAIKSNPDTKDIPIIMCTSKEGSDYAQQAFAVGAIGILPKPAPAATLMSLLNRLDSNVNSSEASMSDNKAAPSQSVGISTRVVENLVRKVLDDKFEAFQTALTHSIRDNLMQVMQTELGHAKSDLRSELSNRMDTVVREQSSTVGQRVANEAIDARIESLENHLKSQVSVSIAEINSVIEAARRPSPELIEEVKKIAQFTAAATAGEAAKEAATDISYAVAQDVAQEELSNLKSSVIEQVSQQLSAGQGMAKFIGLAGLICGLAALGLILL